MPTLFAAIAPCRFCAGTSWGTTACQAGAWIAPSTPLRNVNSSRFAGVAASSDTMSANAPETSPIPSPVPTRNSRRSRISATAPAGIARRNIGNEAATCTSATMNGSGLRSVINQPAAVLYIHPPMFDTTVAIHSAVKLPYRKGPRRERAVGVEVAWGLTSLLMTTSFMSANPPAERPAFVEIGEAVRTSMAALARVLGRAPRCAPIVTLIAFTGDGRGGRNDHHRQQQQRGDDANEHVRARVYRRAGGHVVH